jgi:hypothetical protein
LSEIKRNKRGLFEKNIKLSTGVAWVNYEDSRSLSATPEPKLKMATKCITTVVDLLNEKQGDGPLSQTLLRIIMQ